MIFGLIPACGHSVRMGCPKLALPLGTRTVMEHTVCALREGGADTVLVVLGPHVPQLVPLAAAAGAQALVLPHATVDMRETVLHGLQYLEESYHPDACDAWLLAPGDSPTLHPQVVRDLLEARRHSPKATIFRPRYGNRRGHPALIGWQHVSLLRALPVGVGLNIGLRMLESETLEIDADSEVLVDLDTPEDYDRLKERYRSPGEK